MSVANPFAQEFPVGRFSGRCASCGQVLGQGEVYYAVIGREGREWVRKDFDAKCWVEAPRDALGVWRARVPAAKAAARRRYAPARVLMGVFERLADAEGQAAAKLRFVLALLLLRRRVLRDAGRTWRDGQEVWQMRRAADDGVFDVVCPPLSAQDVDEVSRQLADLLAGLEEQAEPLG
jgi:hypothetical protein